MQKTNTILEDIKRIIKTVDYLYENDFNYPQQESEESEPLQEPGDGNIKTFEEEPKDGNEQSDKQETNNMPLVNYEFLFYKVIQKILKGIKNSSQNELLSDVAKKLEPEKIKNLFDDYIKDNYILCPTSELIDKIENNTSKDIIVNVCKIYENSIKMNTKGKFGQMLELLYGQVPHSDPTADFGGDLEHDKQTELKTKQNKVKSGIVGITTKIVPVNEIFNNGDLGEINTDSDTENKFKNQINEIIGIDNEYNVLSKFISLKIIENKLEVSNSFKILFKKDEKDYELNYAISNSTIYSSSTIDTSNDNNGIIGISLTFSPKVQIVRSKNTKVLPEINEQLKNININIPLDLPFKLISDKCPNLFLARGNCGTKNLTMNDSINNGNNKVDVDWYKYTEGTLYKWNEETKKEFLPTLIQNGLIKISLSLTPTLSLAIRITFDYKKLILDTIEEKHKIWRQSK